MPAFPIARRRALTPLNLCSSRCRITLSLSLYGSWWATTQSQLRHGEVAGRTALSIDRYCIRDTELVSDINVNTWVEFTKKSRLTFSNRSPSKRIAGISFITFLSSSKLANNSEDTSQISKECVKVSCTSTNKAVKDCTECKPTTWETDYCWGHEHYFDQESDQSLVKHA